MHPKRPILLQRKVLDFLIQLNFQGFYSINANRSPMCFADNRSITGFTDGTLAATKHNAKIQLGELAHWNQVFGKLRNIPHIRENHRWCLHRSRATHLHRRAVPRIDNSIAYRAQIKDEAPVACHVITSSSRHEPCSSASCVFWAVGAAPLGCVGRIMSSEENINKQ